LAPRVARAKPIVAMLREITGDIPDLLAQMGVLGVHTLDDMLDLLAVLDGQAVPSGNRVAIVADALGSVSFTEAACRAAGLHVEATVAMDPEAEPADFAAAVSRVLTDPATPVDAAIVVYSAALLPRPHEVAAAIAAAHEASEAANDRTVVAAFPGHDIGGHLPATGTRRIPDLGFPDAAARALAAAARYGIWLRQPVGEVPELPGLDLPAAEQLVRGWIGRAAIDHLDFRDVSALLAVAGLSVVEQRFVSGADEAAAAAATIGRPVALKAMVRGTGAKTEVAGVALDLQNPDEVSASWPRMAASLGSGMSSAVVQAMVPPGLDLRIVLEPAQIVGSVIGVGAGGVHSRTLAPVARAVLPLTDVTARTLLTAAGIDLLVEERGLDAVIDVLLRVSALADEVPHLERLDLNPVIVSDGRAWLVDGTATVIPNPDQAPEDLRRLSS
jgi:acyl-CoA synthetase (NDP forming)